MKNALNYDLVDEVALKTDIEPAFIEKDWYAMQLLEVLKEFKSAQGLELVLSGGTSLSKGFGLIKRFSEDLDFFLCASNQIARRRRRSFRNSIISHIRDDPRFTIDDDKILSGNRYQYFKSQVKYDMRFQFEFLRPYLQLDMTFIDHRLPLLKQNVQSVVSELTGEGPKLEVTCVSPIETASNKVSALTWRVVVRNRSSEKDDPTLIRHLHDLAALKHIIWEHMDDFVSCTLQSLLNDQERGGDDFVNSSVSERLSKAYKMLSTDEIYREEYKEFVQNMSYTDKDEQISFDEALASLAEIFAIFE